MSGRGLNASSAAGQGSDPRLRCTPRLQPSKRHIRRRRGQDEMHSARLLPSRHSSACEEAIGSQALQPELH